MKRVAFLATVLMGAGLSSVLAYQQPSQPVRRTYPGLRTLPGQGATATAVAPGQLVTNPAAVDPMTNNAPVIRVAPTALPGASNAIASGRSKVTPLQFENINRLDVALNALRLPTRDVVASQQALLDTLRAAPIGSVKPTPELLDRLGNRLAEVVPTLNLTAQQRRQLAIDVNMALNSGNLSSVEAQRVLADARAVLQGNAAANRQGVDALAQDLNAVVSNIQSNTSTAQHSSQTNASPNQTTGPTEAGQSAGPQTGAGSGNSQTEPPPTR